MTKENSPLPSAAEAKKIIAMETKTAETDVMRIFARTHKDKFRFNHTRGHWMVWNGHKWQQDEKQQSRLAVFDLVDSLKKNAERRLIPAMSKVGFSNNVMNGAQAMPEVATARDDYDAAPLILNTPAGPVNLRTGKTAKPDPKQMLSKSTSVAPADTADCPEWKKFVRWAMSEDEDSITYLQKLLGYCLSGLMNEEVLHFFYGTGGNGKGTIIKQLALIMGDYYVASKSSTFMSQPFQAHTTEIAKLDGARLVTASEVNKDDKWDMGRIKDLTGNEAPIAARFMRRDEFEFWPTCKLIIIGNSKPAFESVDPAIERRLRLLNFRQQSENPDNTLKDRLAKEHPQILRWMIDGFLLWQKEGLEPPTVIKASSADYVGEENTVANFMRDAMELRPQGRLVKSQIKAGIAAYREAFGVERKLALGEVNKTLAATDGITEGYFQDAMTKKSKPAWHGVNFKSDFWSLIREWQEKRDQTMYNPSEEEGAEKPKPFNETKVDDDDIPF